MGPENFWPFIRLRLVQTWVLNLTPDKLDRLQGARHYVRALRDGAMWVEVSCFLTFELTYLSVVNLRVNEWLDYIQNQIACLSTLVYEVFGGMRY